MNKFDYNFLNNVYASKAWKKIGIKRRAGIMCPLFSIYSEKSIGIGDFLDLKILIDWCKITENTILQLLPVNDTGYGFSPYSSVSSFALDPIYISLENVKATQLNISEELEKLRQKFPLGNSRVNYDIKAEKIKVLRNIFQTTTLDFFDKESFEKFKLENAYWLEEYVEYKVLKEIFDGKDWQEWEDKYKYRDTESICFFRSEKQDDLEFYRWAQWQLFEQFKEVHEYAKANGIYIMGDIPFLVSGDSADVWGPGRDIFDLDQYAGCPPDAYNAFGQKWGMPAYNWQELKRTNYEYFKNKLKYTENFYDLHRIDHVVGIFRLWTISKDEPEENGGLNGKFNPEDERLWEQNGKQILKAMIDCTDMLPCAEDLGVIPPQCPKVLNELGIPGIEVQRWLKDRDADVRYFKKNKDYRYLSCAISSGHDMSNTASMWQYELGTVDEASFRMICNDKGLDFEKLSNKLFDIENSKHGRLRWKKEISTIDILLWNIGRDRDEVYDIIDMYKETYGEKDLFADDLELKGAAEEDISKDLMLVILRYISSASSIFCIQSILDWVIASDDIKDLWNFRINFPGTVGPHNWSLKLPFSLEKLLKMNINENIRNINRETNRGS
ncbi:4-alpha-glucanotransferase [bacterium]